MKTAKIHKVVTVILLASIAVTACGKKEKEPVGLKFTPTEYAQLTNWQENAQILAFKAFKVSCLSILKQPADRPMKGPAFAGTVGDWQKTCAFVDAVDDTNDAARKFFEEHFTPLAVTMDGSDKGLFTGYYEPLLHGSFEKSERYWVPLHKKPDDTITVNLGDFRDDLKGRSLVGKIENGTLVPYADRAEIVDGALANKNLELLWVDDPLDAFFLQVQGSGRVQLNSSEMIGVGYAGKNGQVYRSIGRLLVDEGALDPKTVSLASLRQWLIDNPDEQRRVLDANPSYVFFRLLGDTGGPLGSAGVVLTPEVSLAVDPTQLPLNAPMWLEASHPDPLDETVGDLPFQRLMIAQDTGGAIKGAIRGDVFWGFGERAENIAGRMANKGRYYLLLPNALAEKLKGDAND